LSIAAMWSASNACRSPNVYASAARPPAPDSEGSSRGTTRSRARAGARPRPRSRRAASTRRASCLRSGDRHLRGAPPRVDGEPDRALESSHIGSSSSSVVTGSGPGAQAPTPRR
jgi:hypothetical protein